MRKLILVGILVGLLLLSLIVGVYAHGQETNEEDEHDEWEYMEEMHEECEEHHGYNKNNMNGGYMMGIGMM